MADSHRATRPRRLIRDALVRTPSFVSAREVHSMVLDAGEGVGLATVYRTLRSMTLTGEADVVLLPDVEAVYRHCGRDHHHHLVCRVCGAAQEIISPTVAQWSGQLAAEYGYDDVTHAVEIFGRCPSCREGWLG